MLLECRLSQKPTRWTVTEMNLHSNQIGDVGAKALAEAMKENRTVTWIHLAFNRIGDAGSMALADALKENNTEVDLSHKIGDAGTTALAQAIKVNKWAANMNLLATQVGDAGAQALAEALKENNTVTLISLWPSIGSVMLERRLLMARTTLHRNQIGAAFRRSPSQEQHRDRNPFAIDLQNLFV